MVIEKISTELGLSINAIEKIAHRNFLYKTYSIPKKNGTPRVIHHPSKQLKIIQRWLVKNFFNINATIYSTAYSSGNSPKLNAYSHKNAKFLLKTDITKFFENIGEVHIESLIKSIMPEISNRDLNFIMQIVLYKKHLTVGSPSSPHLSNLVMRNFDTTIVERINLLTNEKLQYTRYADDIFISSKKHIDQNVLTIIDEELDKLGMSRNRKKTRFVSRSHRMQITGIVVDNFGELTVGSKYYLETKKMLYNYFVKDEGNRDMIIGRMSYIKSVNPSQYFALKTIYSRYNKNKIEL